MEEIKIQLHFNPADFKEIYYRDGSGSVFRFAVTRYNLATALGLVVISILLYNRAMKYSEIWAVCLLVFAVLFLVIVAFGLIVQVRNLFKRQWVVNSYHKRLSKAKSHWLILNDFTLEIK